MGAPHVPSSPIQGTVADVLTGSALSSVMSFSAAVAGTKFGALTSSALPSRNISKSIDGWPTACGTEIIMRWPGASVETTRTGCCSAPEAKVATTR